MPKFCKLGIDLGNGMMLENNNKENSGLIPAAITDTGCERELNEDRYAVVECESGVMWIVCDGMGGVAGGELAAQLAIDGIKRELESMPERRPSSATKQALTEANRVIVLRRQNQAFARMGTTLVCAMFHEVEVAITSVGDSRCYLIRNNSIQQLTKDDTYVQQMVDRGEITLQEAMNHPEAHVLTKAIGAQPGLEFETHTYYIWNNPQHDILLMCSDGLYSHVEDQEILKIVSNNTPQRACAKLVDLAKDRGGFDNITIAIVPMDGQLSTEPPPGYEFKKKVKAKVKDPNAFNWKKYSSMLAMLSLVTAALVFLLVLVSLKG